MGDFNAPDVNWVSLCGHTTFSSNLCDFIFDFNLSQLVNVPTHVKGNILELVIVKSEELISNLSVHSTNQPWFSSDHYMISFSLQLSGKVKIRQGPRYVLDYAKAD